MGLHVFQGYVSLSAGLFHCSHFCGGLDSVQKHCSMHTKVNLLYFEIVQQTTKSIQTLAGDSSILAQNTELFQPDKRLPQV